ncbi:hypothetical protein Tco_0115918 [Tanacetum coccineum]
MPPQVINKPYTKPPKEKELLAFIKTLGCDEDLKQKMLDVPHFVATLLYQHWGAILSLLNRCNAEEKPEDQNVSLVRSGRGKGYMCLGNQEVNVSSKPKQIVVLRKKRTITVADNIVEQETMAVELAKSVSIEEQRLQQREIMTRLKIEKQVGKDVDKGYAAKRGLKLKGVATEDPAVQSLLALRKGSKESKLKHVRKEMQAGRREGKDDDDAAGFGVFMYNKSKALPKFTPISPIITCSSMEDFKNLLNNPPKQESTDLLSASEVPFGTNIDVQATDFVLQEMFEDTADHQKLIQAKAKKLMEKAKHNKLCSNFKKEVELNFKEYDQKMEDLSSTNVPKAIEESIQVKVLTKMKKQLPKHVPQAGAKFVKPRLKNSLLEVMKNNQINPLTTTSPTTTADLS